MKNYIIKIEILFIFFIKEENYRNEFRMYLECIMFFIINYNLWSDMELILIFFYRVR